MLRVGLPFTSLELEIISCMLSLALSVSSTLLYQKTVYTKIMTICISLFSSAFPTIWQGQMKTIMFLPLVLTHLDPTVEKNDLFILPTGCAFCVELCSLCLMSEIRKNSHCLWVSSLSGPVYPLIFSYILGLELSCFLVSLKMYFLFLFLFHVCREERRQSCLIQQYWNRTCSMLHYIWSWITLLGYIFLLCFPLKDSAFSSVLVYCLFIPALWSVFYMTSFPHPSLDIIQNSSKLHKDSFFFPFIYLHNTGVLNLEISI